MSNETSTTSTSGPRPKRVVVPKVWKRPHSTIYGKNVEFGSSLYSDKLGEINGRKFNSELPWTMRNSGASSALLSSSSSGSHQSQGYLSSASSSSPSPLSLSSSSSLTRTRSGSHFSGLISGPQTNRKLVDLLAPRPTLDSCLASVAYAPGMSSSLPSGGLCSTASESATSGAGQSASKYDFCGKLIEPKEGQFIRLLEATNPNSLFKRKRKLASGAAASSAAGGKRIDFYERYGHLMDRDQSDNTAFKSLIDSPLIRRQMMGERVEFDADLGIFLSGPNVANNCDRIRFSAANLNDDRASRDSTTKLATNIASTYSNPTNTSTTPNNEYQLTQLFGKPEINMNYNQQLPSTTMLINHNNNNNYNYDNINNNYNNYNYNNNNNNNHELLPHVDRRKSEILGVGGDYVKPTLLHLPTNYQLKQHEYYGQFGLERSPYGQSADGRKLSLGSINPQSYRPSLPAKTSTAHSSDGEEFEFHDRSSPFYTDRWAGKTIRHFDSDLYSNANLFKSMIL